MDISSISDTLSEDDGAKQRKRLCRTVSFAQEPSADKIPVRLKINIPKATISNADAEDTTQPDLQQQQQIEHGAVVEPSKVEQSVVKLVPPTTPITSFKPSSRPPYEAKTDKQFVIYVPYSFEELKPHFTSPTADAKQLFATLTGNKIPRSTSKTHSYGMWGVSRTAVGPAYIAFMKDLDREEILASRIPAADGSGKEWTRLEFGRDLWNMGQNYGVTVQKGIEEAKDSERVKEVLAEVASEDEDEDEDESEGDAMDLDEPERDDSDGDWAPRSRKKARR